MSDAQQRRYNLKSPGVKRLMREAVELREPTEQYYAQPLEDNLFEWHFTVRGPPDTEFDGGRYHGRITLPPEYPMKPPSIMLLTPNGRFELGKKICLSMSAHHPETWQPSWSIRTVLLALIGFMPSKGAGAIGSLDYTPAERKALAARSLIFKCETCLMDHSNCLMEGNPDKDTSSEMNEAKELAAQISFKGEPEKGTSNKEAQNDQNTQAEAMAQFQRDFQQFMQNIQANPGFQPNFNMSQHPNYQALNTVNNTNVTQSATATYARPSTTQTDTSSPNTQSSVTSASNTRQRNVPSTNAENSTNISNNVHRTTNRLNTRRSFFDTLTLWLMWLVTAMLVILIIRRLALEKTNLTKS